MRIIREKKGAVPFLDWNFLLISRGIFRSYEIHMTFEIIFYLIFLPLVLACLTLSAKYEVTEKVTIGVSTLLIMMMTWATPLAGEDFQEYFLMARSLFNYFSPNFQENDVKSYHALIEQNN
jgi:hypothetical protein